MNHRKSKAFVILTHGYKPITKGPQTGKVQVTENCEFVRNVKTIHLQQASIIMDVEKRILIKNAAKEKGADYDDIEAHVVKGYEEKYIKFLTLTESEIPDHLIKEEEVDVTVEDDEGNAPKVKRKKIQQDLIDKSKEPKEEEKE